jgi:glycine/D-amino acid oxidase-like deaminating enzyme
MKYCVIGGGIAGTSCALELCRLADHKDGVTLISASRVLKVDLRNVADSNDKLQSRLNVIHASKHSFMSS